LSLLHPAQTAAYGGDATEPEKANEILYEKPPVLLWYRPGCPDSLVCIVDSEDQEFREEIPSQLSREFMRLFGHSPSEVLALAG
jgi:hypothetical protein